MSRKKNISNDSNKIKDDNSHLRALDQNQISNTIDGSSSQGLVDIDKDDLVGGYVMGDIQVEGLGIDDTTTDDFKQQKSNKKKPVDDDLLLLEEELLEDEEGDDFFDDYDPDNPAEEDED